MENDKASVVFARFIIVITLKYTEVIMLGIDKRLLISITLVKHEVLIVFMRSVMESIS